MFGFQAPTVRVKFERAILDLGFFMLTQKNVLLLIFVKTKKTEKVVESSRIINANLVNLLLFPSQEVAM